jgi:hypothetical protein
LALQTLQLLDWFADPPLWRCRSCGREFGAHRVVSGE